MQNWQGRSLQEIQIQINLLRERIEMMKKYMSMRQEMSDWHGVMDASADIRELEAEIRSLFWVMTSD